jgi:hypothetical protein
VPSENPGAKVSFCFSIFFSISRQPLVGQGTLTVEISWSHSLTPHSVGLLWRSDRPDAETSTYTTQTLYKRQTSMTPMGFEPTMSASKRPQTHALDCAATGIGFSIII